MQVDHILYSVQNVGRVKLWQTTLYMCMWIAKLWEIEQVFYYINALTMFGWENCGELKDDR